MKMNIEDRVHQLANGRWVVAEWVESANQYQAPMTQAEQEATGCGTYYAKSLEGLGCTSYASRDSAVRRAKQVYGDV